MQETPQEYTKRILGFVEGQDAIKVQQATPKKLARLLRGLPRKVWSKRPGPGRWSIGEIMAHLSETELVGGYRLRTILGANGAPIQAFNQDDWARAGNYAGRDPSRSLELFCALREANLALLKELTPAQWQQFGVHQERGNESVAHIALLYAGHDLNHLQQIERLLAQSAPARRGRRRH